jgi:hypothetical protein
MRRRICFRSLSRRVSLLGSMRSTLCLVVLSVLIRPTLLMRYRPDLVSYNLNNSTSANVLQYDTTRLNSTYTPSPLNWRALPFYTILLDKFADGDPSNNDFFKTLFENDWRETQLRYGGDVQGLLLKLDYLQGMGIKAIFISGTIFVNMPWQADSSSLCSFQLVHLMPHQLQATHHLTFHSPILIGVLSTTGVPLSMKSMRARCTSCLTLLLALWETSSVFRGSQLTLSLCYFTPIHSIHTDFSMFPHHSV